MERMVRSMVLVAPRKFEWTAFERPRVGPEDLLLKVEEVSICGSDPGVYNGGVWKIFPIIPGHEVVGFVDEVGDEAAQVHGVKQGDRVNVEPYIMCGRCKYCLTGHYQLCKNLSSYGINLSSDRPPHLWGAYGEYLFVPRGGKVHKIAKEVPSSAAALSSVVGNGYRWVQTKGQVKAGDAVVIIGAGAQGLVSTIVAKEAGASPIIVLGLTRDAQRFELAKEFGAHHVVDIEKEKPEKMVAEYTDGEMADVVVQCAGSMAALRTALRVAKPMARCVLVGVSDPNASVDVPSFVRTFGRIQQYELTLLGGLGQAWNVEPAVKLINSRKYPIEKIVTHKYGLQQAEEGMNFFMSTPPDCVRVSLVP